jgi:dTDP-4-amino-4,6-dideoxygalactose transaminase
MPCRMTEILEVCNRHYIPIIEDAAEALGSTYKNQPVGSFSLMCAVSFNGNKIITTSSGGVLTSADAKLIDRARFLSTQAKDPAPHFEHPEIGYNYRLSNILAALGIGQLESLDARITKRRAIFEHYRKRLSVFTDIEFLTEPEDSFSNRWLTTLLLPKSDDNNLLREEIRIALRAQGIDARPLWKPLHIQKSFSGCEYVGSNSTLDFFSRGLCLPSGNALTDNQINHICDIIINILEMRV